MINELRNLYLYNQALSIRLCLQMEHLVLELSYHQRKNNSVDTDRVSAELNKIRTRIDWLWERQVVLFFEIKKGA